MIPFAVLAIVVARCLMPAMGVLFLHWDPARVLVMCFLDTVLSLVILLVAFVYSSSKSVAATVATGVFLIGGLAVPLAIPLFFMLAPAGFSLTRALADPAFRMTAVIQALMTAGWAASIVLQLRTRTPEQLGARPLLRLIFLRWAVLIVLTFTGIPWMLGTGGPYLLVIAYAGALVFSELNPRRFLRLLPDPGK